MRLRTLNESRIIRISREEYYTLHNMAQKLYANWEDNSGKTWEMEFKDRPNVSVIFNDPLDVDRKDNHASVNIGHRLIYLNRDKIKHDVGDIYDTLVHEFTHLLDPKSSMDLEYDEYYANPKEFDAFSGEFVSRILHVLEELAKIDSMGRIKAFMNKVEKFMKEPYDDIHDSRRLMHWLYPNTDNPIHDAVYMWSFKPKLWRKFKLRIFKATQEFLDKLNAIGARDDMKDDYAAS
jgi:hypothetical protein